MELLESVRSGGAVAPALPREPHLSVVRASREREREEIRS